MMRWVAMVAAVLVADAAAASLESRQWLLPVGVDIGKAWCADARFASASGLDAVSARVRRYVAEVLSQAEAVEREAGLRADEARRVARQAFQVLSQRQLELARLEAVRREGAGAAPDAALLEAEVELDKAEKALAFHRGLVDRASRLRKEYERISANSDPESGQRKRELDREIAVAEQAVVANVWPPRPDLQTLTFHLDIWRSKLGDERVRLGGPVMVSAADALWTAKAEHQRAVTEVSIALLDIDAATAIANRARANRDGGTKCIADRRAQLDAEATPAPGAGTPTPPPVPPVPGPTAPGPRADFATTFYLTRFGWESGMSGARPVAPYLGGFYFHPNGTVTGWLQNAGALSGTWQGSSANGKIELSGAAQLKGEWRLSGLAFGSDALGGPIATAGQGSWCVGRVKGLHYFGGISPTPTNFPGFDDRPKPGMTPPPADAEAMCSDR